MVINILIYITIFLSGFYIRHLMGKYADSVRRNNLIRDINNQFKEVLSNILSSNSIFKNRVNNTVYINTKLKDYDDVNVIYLMDRKDIAIFKDGKCIYTSEMVEKDTIKSITTAIDKKFEDKINTILDSKYYKSNIDKLSNELVIPQKTLELIKSIVKN